MGKCHKIFSANRLAGLFRWGIGTACALILQMAALVQFRSLVAGFLVVLPWFSPSTQAADIALAIDDIVSPAFHAKSIRAGLSGPELSRFEARIGEVSFAGRTWRNVRLTCMEVRLESSAVQCPHGTLMAGRAIPLSFRYGTAPRRLELTLNPASDESWRATVQWNKSDWQASVAIANGNPAHLADFLPEGVPRPNGGRISGTFGLVGGRSGTKSVAADLTAKGLGFSDAAGLHAGEKLAGRVKLAAARSGVGWAWHGDVDWQDGQVFWQPLYMARGGHRFEGEGTWGEDGLKVSRGSLKLAGVGTVDGSGTWNLRDKRLAEFSLRGRDLDLGGLYPVLLKPFLAKTAFARMDARGRADLDWRFRDGSTTTFDVALRDAFLEDEDGRFALQGVNARIPWVNGEERQADVRIRGGRLLRIPLGEMQLPLAMRGWNFSLPSLSVPVLDGNLNIENFEAKKLASGWEWGFSGGLTPVAMEGLSAALKLPAMHGTLSGVIPRVHYSAQGANGSELIMDGALLVKVFDGTVVVKNLSLLDPLGRAPRLHADVDMRRLDLDLLTKTFSFGRMQGRIDATVENLELADWQPVKFDAEIRSSPGDYPKRISQRAVENITALGGASASAAIQRSFLQVFKEFGYSRIGLSCRLRNGVCLMDGLEPASQGYVIVKGGGIPAINVIGYNHNVSWDELLERLKRITQANVRPIVQ